MVLLVVSFCHEMKDHWLSDNGSDHNWLIQVNMMSVFNYNECT